MISTEPATNVSNDIVELCFISKKNYIAFLMDMIVHSKQDANGKSLFNIIVDFDYCMIFLTCPTYHLTTRNLFPPNLQSNCQYYFMKDLFCKKVNRTIDAKFGMCSM